MRLTTLTAMLSATALLAINAGALPLLDPGKEKPEVALHSSEERNQSFQYEALGGTPALSVKWDNAKANYFEFNLPSRLRLPEFTKAQLRVRAYIPAGKAPRNLNLRITDQEGETFQFSKPITAGPEGWREFVYEIDPAKPDAGSWGNKTNKKIDFPAAVTGFASDFNAKTGSGNIGIGPVSIDILATDRPFIVSLETGSQVHVLTADASPLNLRIRNICAVKVNAELGYTVSDAFGASYDTGNSTFSLAPEEEKLLPIDRPKKFGVYYADVTCRESGSKAEPLKKQLSFCYMVPAGPTPGMARGYLFGVCSHPQGKSVADQNLEALAAALCGVKILREDIHWGRMQPTRDRWNFESFDRTVEIFGKYNIELEAIYSYVPGWAVAKEWKPVSTTHRGNGRPDYGDWANFIRAFAERYKGKVRYVEVWNEPDLIGFANFPANEYIEMMKIAYRETKKAAPEMVVLTGGFACMPGLHPRMSDPQLMPKVLAQGKGSFDVHAFHGHGTFTHYRNQIEQMLEMRRELGTAAPWYANETAISSIHIGELPQAVTLFQKFLYSWTRGSIGYNWYDLRNDGDDPKENEHNFGLITRDFHPKAAYGVYNTLSLLYQNGEFLRDLSPDKDSCIYLFRAANGDFLLPNWSVDTANRPHPVLLEEVTGKAAIVDLFGNERELPVRNGLLMFDAGRTPSSIRLSGQAKEPRFAGEILRQLDEFTLRPGEKRGFRFELFNPTKRPLNVKLNFALPEGLKSAQTEKSLRLAPGKSEKFQLELTADDAFRSFPGQLKTIRMNLDAIGVNTYEIPVRSVTALSGKGLPKKPDFTIDKAEQGVILAPNDPTKSHLFWTGPEDLSAQIRLGRDGDNLVLKADVTDDVHFQEHRGGEVWKGDNIQFAIKLPGQNIIWEIGLTRLADGSPEVYVWNVPKGFDREKTAKAIKLETSRDEKAKLTTYTAKIPFSTIGLTEEIGKNGFRFNLLVNDNDGEMRESFFSIAPGIGEEKRPDSYPVVTFGK